jgi:hypothetical protein
MTKAMPTAIQTPTKRTQNPTSSRSSRDIGILADSDRHRPHLRAKYGRLRAADRDQNPRRGLRWFSDGRLLSCEAVIRVVERCATRGTRAVTLERGPPLHIWPAAMDTSCPWRDSNLQPAV